MGKAPNLAYLDAKVADLIRRIEDLAADLRTVVPNFDKVILRPFQLLRRVAFHDNKSEAAFELDRNQMTMLLNAQHIISILTQIDRSEKAAFKADSNKNLEAVLREMAVDVFVLHEIRHCSQGVPRHDDVQLMKATEGPLLMSKLDLMADIEAVRIWAWLNHFEGGGNFEDYLVNGLYFLCNVCVPAFGVSADKPGKVARALGLYLILARATGAVSGEVLDAFGFPIQLSLDTAIFPALSPDFRSVTLIALEPELIVLVPGRAIPFELVLAFCAYVEDNDVNGALEIAVLIGRHLFGSSAK